MEHQCEFFLGVDGKHPNTGEPMRKHECAVKLTPVFLMAVTQAVTKLDAETSEARSEARAAAANLNEFFNMLNTRMSNAPTQRNIPTSSVPTINNDESTKQCDEKSNQKY